MQMEGLDAYMSLKQTILAFNASLVAAGTLCESLASYTGTFLLVLHCLFRLKIWSPQFAALFAVGGIGGLAYQYLLQESVDTIGAGETEVEVDAAVGRF